MFDVEKLASIKVGLASPEKLENGLMVKLQNLKPLTIEAKNQKWMVSSVKKSLDLAKTMNVIVVNIKRLDMQV